MKRKITTLLIMAIMLFSLPTAGFASESEENTDNIISVSPGITPDSWLYGLDNFINELNLIITTDAAKKAGLIQDISEERLAEAKKMIDENKAEYGVIAMNAYKKTLQEAVDTLDDAIINEKDIDEVVDQFSDTFVNRQELIQSIVEQFPEDVRAELNKPLEDVIDNMVLTINLADGKDYSIVINNSDEDTSEAEEDIDEVQNNDGVSEDESINEEENNKEVVTLPLKKVITSEKLSEEVNENAAELYASGELNVRQILSVHSFSQQTGKSFEEVLDVFMANQKGIGATAKALGLAPKDALKGVKHTFKNVKKQIQDDFKTEEKGLKLDIEDKEEYQDTQDVENKDFDEEHAEYTSDDYDDDKAQDINYSKQEDDDEDSKNQNKIWNNNKSKNSKSKNSKSKGKSHRNK